MKKKIFNLTTIILLFIASITSFESKAGCPINSLGAGACGDEVVFNYETNQLEVIKTCQDPVPDEEVVYPCKLL